MVVFYYLYYHTTITTFYPYPAICRAALPFPGRPSQRKESLYPVRPWWEPGGKQIPGHLEDELQNFVRGSRWCPHPQRKGVTLQAPPWRIVLRCLPIPLSLLPKQGCNNAARVQSVGVNGS